MNPRFWKTLLVAACGSALLGAIACSGGDDDEAGSSASPTVAGTILRPAGSTAVPTLGTAPDATATPVLSPEEQASGFRLEEAPAGLLQWVTDGPYVVPGDAIGAFLLDVETKEIEGWYDLVGATAFYGFSGDNRFLVFQRERQAFVGETIYPAGTYLADRETQRVYRWAGDAELVLDRMAFNANDIASRNGVILLRVNVEDDDDWFVAYDVDAQSTLTTFRADATWALFSDDGTRIALAGDDIHIVETSSGNVSRVDQQAFTSLDLEGRIELLGTSEGFLVTSNPVKDRFDGYWLRYSWDGDLLAQGSARKVFPSPDGETVVEAEVLVEVGGEPLYSFEAISTLDRSPLFRAVGVTTWFGFQIGNRWLADNSGFAVGTPGFRVSVATEEGSVNEIMGVPSPNSPGVFALLNSTAVTVSNAEGKTLLSIPFLGGVQDFFDPWGDNGDEVRVAVPHGGHDGPGSVTSIIEPYVELPPFDQEPLLRLSEIAGAFGQLQLRSEPGTGDVIGEVRAPYEVEVLETAKRCSPSGAFTDCPSIDARIITTFQALISGAQMDEDLPLTSVWARVRTTDGQEGWLIVQAGPQGV